MMQPVELQTPDLMDVSDVVPPRVWRAIRQAMLAFLLGVVTVNVVYGLSVSHEETVARAAMPLFASR